MGERRRFFQRMLRAGLLPILTLMLVLAPSSPAQESEPADTYTQMLRRYDEMNAELEHAINEIERGVSVAPYPKRVLSMRTNASVTVGGEVRTNYVFAEGGGTDPQFAPGAPARGEYDSKTGSLYLSTARVSVDARAGDRWRAYIDVNLHDQAGFHEIGNKEPSFINQAYIELMKGSHTGFGAIAGIVKLPFGLWRRPNLFAQSFLDAPDLNGSYLMHPAGWRDALPLPHASRFPDPALTAMLYYEMRDIIRFDAAIFQESRTGEDVTRTRNGVTEIRTDEPPPLSWQIGASAQPLDGWELTAHFRNRHSRTRGIGRWSGNTSRWDFLDGLSSADGGDPRWDAGTEQWSDAGTGPSFGATKNEQSLVVGVAGEIPNTKLSVSAEYALGWNQGFNKHIESQSVNLAFAYKLTPKLTLHAQGEWLRVTDGSWMAETPAGWERDARSNQLYRVMLGAEYELMRHMTLEAGWQYEYWKTKSAALDEARLNTVNMLYFGTRFLF